MPRRPWTDAVARANATAKQPVLFIVDHGMAPDAWSRWIGAMEDAGYAGLELSGPPEVADAVGYVSEVAQALSNRPAIIGHGMGGLVAQILAGEGLSAASVALAPDLLASDRPRGEALSLSRGPVLVMVGDDDPNTARRGSDQDAGWERLVLPGHGRDLQAGLHAHEATEAALIFIQRFV